MDSADFTKALLSALQDSAIRDALGDIVGGKLKNEMASLRAEAEQTRNEVCSLRKELKQKDADLVSLRKDVSKLESEIEYLEQYSRRNTIRICGVAEDEDEDVTQEAMAVFEKISIPKPVAPTDIDRLHRVGKKSSDKGPRPILVKFATYAARERVTKARRSLQDTDLYVNEDVTSERWKLLYKLRKLKDEKKIDKVWTHDGTVVVKDSHNKIHYARLLHEVRALIETLKAV